MDIDPEENWQGKMQVQVTVGAGQFVTTELATVLVLENDDPKTRQKIAATCSMLLNCLPLTELRGMERQYVSAEIVPVVKSDGTVAAVTPEIARAATEQQKLRKTMEKKDDQAQPPEAPVL